MRYNGSILSSQAACRIIFYAHFMQYRHDHHLTCVIVYPGQCRHTEATSSKRSAPSVSPRPASRRRISMPISPFHTRATSQEDSQGQLGDDPITTHWSPSPSANNSQALSLSPPFDIEPFSDDDNPFQPSPIECKYFYPITHRRCSLVLPLFNSITSRLRCRVHAQ